jgi:recombination endonuclease VII
VTRRKDAPPIRPCTKCGMGTANETQVCFRHEPHPNRRINDGLTNQQRWARRHPEQRPRINRQNVLRRYGLTLVEYDAILAEQGGGCAICGSTYLLTVDHDHGCCQPMGKGRKRRCGNNCYRGILCANCNSGLGRFQDSPEVLAAALAYLSGWKAKGKVNPPV